MTETKLRTRLGIGLATLSAAALALTTVAPAFAADVQLGPDDIAGYENGAEGTDGYNYDNWHIGSVWGEGAEQFTAEDSLTFGECGVTILAPPADASATADWTQVLLGFPVNGRISTAPDGTVDDWRALLESVSIDVVEGQVALQIPMFVYWNGDYGDVDFSTLRNATTFGPGVHSFGSAPLTDTNGFIENDWIEIGLIPGANTDDLLEAFEYGISEYDDIYEILGVGFVGSEGAVVNSISFGGNTYYFGTGDCLPVDEIPEVPETPEVPEAPEPPAPTPPDAVETARQ